MRAAVIVGLLVLGAVPAAASAQSGSSGGMSNYRLAPGFLKGAHVMFPSAVPQGAGKGLSFSGLMSSSNGIQGLDSILNWNEAAPTAPGFTYWNTVGTPPTTNGTTTFDAPIVPVVVSLRDANGNQAFDPTSGQPLISSPSEYVQPVLHSPMFQRSTYTSSSIPTQFTDAIQRAEYWGREQSNWHTELAPSVKAPLQLNVPYGKYYYSLNSNGSCCRDILVDYNTFGNLMFPPTYPVDNSTVLGQAELNGDITTKDISTFLFPNTYLYEGTLSNCCVLGYHTFDFEPGATSNDNPRAYVMNYSSWITPGLFHGGLSDITALSHELSETFNDPFVTAFGDNHTPWWLAPNGVCQNNRETGDVIENLPNGLYPMTMHGFTYHPQNEALLPWFAFQQTSTAIDGAYSYPNEGVLTGPSAPQNPFCA